MTVHWWLVLLLVFALFAIKLWGVVDEIQTWRKRGKHRPKFHSYVDRGFWYVVLLMAFELYALWSLIFRLRG